MLWYVKEKKMIEAAEDVTHTLHNTYSLRGAKIRDPLAGQNILTPLSTAGATMLKSLSLSTTGQP